MAKVAEAPEFQMVVEAVESLPLEDQAVLVEVIRMRIAEKERARVMAEAAEARGAYRDGDVRRGSAADLLTEMDG